eukprot:GGOE01036687.1.p1 GENE.GGOE01036687.1~~GGOE01036687.1.p1  ORF type:complete len:417 (+),score=122.88 GGOE01036687.1:87-1253(+)
MAPRSLAGFSVPALGSGCMRTTEADQTSLEALHLSLTGGCNLVDTASNYEEDAVGRCLQTLMDSKALQREEVVVVTKVGSIQHGIMAVARAQEAAGKPFPEVVKVHPSFWHCLHPEFLRHQVEASTARLGTAPDVVLLHNPEFFYTAARRQGDRPVGEFHRRLRSAFHCLEEMVAEGRMQCYGVSSNTEGCYYSVSGGPNTFEATSLPSMMTEAEAAAGELGVAHHHFRVLQVPFNVLEPGALLDADEGFAAASTAKVAADNGISIMGNRPLNAIAPAGFGAGDWGKEAQFLKLADTVPMRTSLALLRNLMHDALQGTEGHSRRLTVAQLALWLAASAPGLACSVTGTRQPPYVDDMLTVLGLPPLPAERVTAVVRTVDAALQEMGVR